MSNFIEVKALPISIIILCMAFCFSGVISYINIYAKELSLIETASYFFIVYTIVVLITRPFTGRMVDKKGAGFIIYPAFVMFSVGLFLLSFTSNGFMLLLSSAFIALGFGNLSSISQAVAINSTTPNRMGLATATFFIFYDSGSGFGPSILGLIISSTSYRTLYFILGIVVLVVLSVYYIFTNKKSNDFVIE
nr:MFS transporter [Terrisporobacter sp.]